jgi:acetyl-CoA carboxylase biotin carboxylase subunit
LTTRRFSKVLIANRGEIAVRVIRACRELGIASVAVFSEPDRAALHVRLADEALPIGPAPARESYLRIDRVLEAARASGADAVHPGYGFLAENPELARACERACIAFIGPRSDTIALLGEKTSARREAQAAGLPVVPGTLEPIADPARLAREAQALGYPVMLKAAAGGGGKGMRLVAKPEELAGALARGQSEAKNAFGDDHVYLEKALARTRHIEIQVLADTHGNAVHLFERECSIQRRNQKVIEESPSPFVSAELRARMGAMALSLVRRVSYVNAGTVEFLVDGSGQPYFLEMNTRLQVEHPVTELVTGLDLVRLQIRIAEGEALALSQPDLALRGHAIECRVYAEDPDQGFLPSPGRISALRVPGGPGVRDDTGVYEGWEVPVHYDPLLSKLSVWAETRDAAIERMRRAVAEYRVLGIRTTLGFFERVLSHPRFRAGELDTAFVSRLAEEPAADAAPAEIAIAAAAIEAYEERRRGRRRVTNDPSASAWSALARREALGSGTRG